MQIDDDAYLADRLNNLMRAEKTIYHYPRLIIMEKLRPTPTSDWRQWIFYGPYLYSLQTDYGPSQYPYTNWKGWTLGISIDKTPANKTSIVGLFGTEKGKMFF